MSKSICRKAAALLLAMIMLLVGAGCRKQQNTISGSQWLYIQHIECFPDLEAYAGGLDEVVSLYIAGAITETDYLVELRILEQQNSILQQRYDNIKQTYPVREGSHTYVSKRGTEGVETCYHIMDDLVTNLKDASGAPLSRDETAYVYLAYKQELNQALAEYLTAIMFVTQNESVNATTDPNASTAPLATQP